MPVPAARAHETANLAALVRAAAPGAALPPDAELRTEWFFAPGEVEEGERTWESWGLDAQSVALFLGARAEKGWTRPGSWSWRRASPPRDARPCSSAAPPSAASWKA